MHLLSSLGCRCKDLCLLWPYWELEMMSVKMKNKKQQQKNSNNLRRRNQKLGRNWDLEGLHWASDLPWLLRLLAFLGTVVNVCFIKASCWVGFLLLVAKKVCLRAESEALKS